MIISKTPFRMSFVGGGSDMHAYFKDNVGAVLSTSINKYVYISVNPKFDNKIRLSYSITEEANSAKDINHPIVRETLRLLDISKGIEISSMADIPSKGSGLGSSSSFTVGLLNALHASKNNLASKKFLAEQACQIEIERCQEPIGKQDQYAAAFGGLNLITFNPDETIKKKLEDSTLVFFTGKTRSASDLLARQQEELKTYGHKNLMHRMVELTYELKQVIETDSIDCFGQILDENWRLKSQLTKGISSPEIDFWYSLGLQNGATGGKLLGAGNGGFLMFFAPPEKHKNIIKALSNLRLVKFEFENKGSEIVYSQK
jgi:D-glycero-alpha-D-manno-heptose-7-phosphate kinase